VDLTSLDVPAQTTHWCAECQRLTAEVASLQAERDALRSENETLHGREPLVAKYAAEAIRAESERDAARAEVERLREGLRGVLAGHDEHYTVIPGTNVFTRCGDKNICEVGAERLRALLSGKDAP
jgi:hypothetical protein